MATVSGVKNRQQQASHWPARGGFSRRLALGATYGFGRDGVLCRP
jgi:hypothetical protein